MKNHLLLVALLVLIIVPGIAATRYLASSSQALIPLTDRAIACVEDGDWAAAERFAGDLREGWDERKDAWALLMMHEEIHELEQSIARIEQLIATKDRPGALAELQVVRLLLGHVGEKQRLSLINIL